MIRFYLETRDAGVYILYTHTLFVHEEIVHVEYTGSLNPEKYKTEMRKKLCLFHGVIILYVENLKNIL